MQTTVRHGGGIVIHASPSDTYAFATRPGASWPGSALRSEGLSMEIDRIGDLIDYSGPDDVGADELTAFQDYALELALAALQGARKATNKEDRTCDACGEPMYGPIRIHHHSEDGRDVTVLPQGAATWTPEKGWHDVTEEERQSMQRETVRRITGR
jgi:hypothetical protein